MNHKLLTKLVFSGMKKNKRTMIPFLVAATMTVMIFYILYSLAFCPYIYHNHKEAFYGAQTIAIILEMSGQIVAVFAVLFLLYANQFVMKDRRREIGLYGILGLSRYHIVYILVLETICNAVICISLGIAAGTFLNKIMLLLLYKVIGQSPINGFFFSLTSLKMTLKYFALIFLVCLIYNIFSINVSNPVDLLKSNKVGEREPKVKYVMLFIGVITLALGYYAALSCDSTGEAFNTLFISILLVICATYCLFVTGSIFLLKKLKNNKKFYYKTKNFISVSNLMYRMKHNAAGLASICILSTGVIILLTCGISLVMLGEKSINQRFPKEISIEGREKNDDTKEKYITSIDLAAKKTGIDLKDGQIFQYWSTAWLRKDGEYHSMSKNTLMDSSKVDDIYIFSLDKYNECTGSQLVLDNNEILLYSTELSSPEVLTVLGQPFCVAGSVEYDKVADIVNPAMTLFGKAILVFDSEDTIKQIFNSDEMSKENNAERILINYNADRQLTHEQMDSFQEILEEKYNKKDIMINVDFKQKYRTFFYNIYGGAFFVGIFLSLLFLMATVMIIYYKQMSEGYEDQTRFMVLSQVGMTSHEVKAAIKRQVMILFFLPVVTSIIHMMVAGKIIRLFLQTVIVVDTFTFYLSIFVVSVIFIAVYAFVYKVTSVQYYKIVNASV